MSRSYKSVPVIKDNKYGRKKAKRLANKAVRKSDEVAGKGNIHKKVSCSYDICDYKSYMFGDDRYRRK